LRRYTQELYLLVFVTRYLDLFYSFISLYNTSMKLIFIGSSGCIIWYMRKHKVVSQTYDAEQAGAYARPLLRSTAFSHVVQ
jgi:ER lumen protein retaining receptor